MYAKRGKPGEVRFEETGEALSVNGIRELAKNIVELSLIHI